MAASWPPTSGATRTSVVRTMPTTGGGGSGRHRKYPPTPAAITMPPSAMMREALRLAMHLPPLGESCGNHREREIDDGQAHSPRQSRDTSHRLAPSWSMRTMPSMAKSEGNM